MGNQDEQRKSQFQPMSLPISRKVTPRDDAAASPPPPPAASRAPSSGPGGSRGGQFRPPLPRFGPKSEDDEEPVDLAPARARFNARHGDRQRSMPGAAESASYPAYDDEPEWDDPFDASYGESPVRDPWARDWGAWSATYLPDEGFEDDEELMGGSWRRDAWGDLPNGYTMASVAVEVALPSRRRAAQPKGPAFQQIMRWVRSGFAKSQRPTQKAIRLLLVTSILGVIIMSGLGAGLYAYNDYRTLLAEAKDGSSALSHLSNDLGLSKGSTTTKLDPAQTQAALTVDLTRAMNDFQDIHNRLQHPDFVLTLAGSIPSVRDKLQSGLVLSAVGIQAVQMLQLLSPNLASVANLLISSPIATSSSDNAKFLERSDINALASAFDRVQPIVQQMVQTIQATPPDILVAALSAKQQSEVLPLLQGVPQLPNILKIATEFLKLKSAPSLLGIDNPVAYLLMTLDNTEIRPVGGFQGQYAVVGVNGGHVGHISLEDVYNVLEPIVFSNDFKQNYQVYNGLTIPQENWYSTYAADAKGNGLGWAMRNSGLSPDFTQSARYALWYLHNENTCIWNNPKIPLGTNSIFCTCSDSLNPYYHCIAGGDRIPVIKSDGSISGYSSQHADMAGVIAIQVRVIAQLLSVTGPIRINCPYNETVDASNLQDKIHYYQETSAGRKIGLKTCPGAKLSDSTKRFTALLTQALQAKLKTISKTDLFKFAGDLINDLHTKDIQIYFTDPTADQAIYTGQDAWSTTPDNVYPPALDAEQYLEKYQASAEMYPNLQVQKADSQSGNFDDTLAMSRADMVGWKMERWVKLQLEDHITVDASGNAKHTFQANYTFDIPPINVVKDQNGVPDQTKTDQAIFSVVYNAGFGNTYNEYWRVYTNQTVSQVVDNRTSYRPGYTNLGPYTANSDIPGTAFFQGELSYLWSQDFSGSTVQWGYQGVSTNNSLTYDQEPANLQWDVSNVVHNGKYTLHVIPQAGVNTSIDIVVTGPCGTKTFQGALPSNQVIQVPVAHC